MLLTVNNITKTFSGETVLKNVSLSLAEKDRVGLLGVNGVGKSTLLNIISGDLSFDEGTRSAKNGLAIGYLRQNEALDSDNTLQAEIESALSRVYAVRAELQKVSQSIAQTDAGSDSYTALTAQYEALSNTYAALDGYQADVRINAVLNGLGFGDFDRSGKVRTLSGGEKIRFAMAKVLLQNPELLILDEPTNHLDFEMLTWLEAYLASYKGAVLVVSHDRYFLDRVVRDICELERGELVRYKGGYSAFLRQKEERIRTLEKEYRKQQADLAAMRDYVQKNLAKSSSSNSVGSRVKALEKMELATKPNPREKQAKFSFSYDFEPHKAVLHLQDVGIHVGSAQSGKQLYKGLSFDVQKGEKIALIGRNGVGKSSLLKAIVKRLGYEGVIQVGQNVRIAYFDQELADLNLNDTVLEAVHQRFPTKTEFEIRSALGRLLIEDEAAFKRVCELSGANRAKVAFCILMFERGNFLILDEPTNHLDYTAKEALDSALRAYDGTLLVVSHDRYFLNHVPTKIIELFPDKLCVYKGGYAAYLAAKELKKPESADPPAAVQAPSVQSRAREAERKNKAEERKRRAKLSALQKEIEEMHGRLHALKAECEQPEVADNYLRLTELLEQIEELEATIEEKEDLWLTLSD